MRLLKLHLKLIFSPEVSKVPAQWSNSSDHVLFTATWLGMTSTLLCVWGKMKITTFSYIETDISVSK